MAKIISVGNQKGGVGKTAVTIMSAAALSQTPFNLKTVIIDLDPQKSVVKARKLDLKAYQTDVAPFDVLSYSISDLQANIKRLDKEYQLIFIDTAGKMDNTQPFETQEITKALMYVDCLFIPFVAGNYNLESTVDYFDFIKKIQNIRDLQSRNLQAYGFINLQKVRSKANALLNEDLQILQTSENLKLFSNGLNDYSLFREADTIVSLYDPLSNNAAKHNFSLFINELIKIITA